MAYEKNFTIYSKHAPWVGPNCEGSQIVVLGEDLSGAGFVMTFGPVGGGEAVITLTNAAAGSQGLSAAWDPNYVAPDTGEQEGATTITAQIDETTLEGLSGWDSDPDVAKTLRHDLLITPSGEPQYVERYGRVTIRQGVSD